MVVRVNHAIKVDKAELEVLTFTALSPIPTVFGNQLGSGMILYASAMYMNQMARAKCTHAAVETMTCPTTPRPANTQTDVIHNRPAGLDVVGLDISSMTTLVASNILATRSIDKKPAIIVQA